MFLDYDVRRNHIYLFSEAFQTVHTNILSNKVKSKFSLYKNFVIGPAQTGADRLFLVPPVSEIALHLKYFGQHALIFSLTRNITGTK